MIRGVVAYPIAASDKVPPRRLLLGPENAVLAAALDALIATPGEPIAASTSPLVIVGPTGSGKSLVLDVAANAFADRRDVVRWSGADWCRSYACAVDTDGLQSWRARCRTTPCLIVDALDETAGKSAAQEELCATLDQRRGSGLRSVLSCSSDPLNHDRLAPRLQGRLAQGLIVHAAPPGRETLRSLLDELAEDRRFPLPDDVADALIDALQGESQRTGPVTHHRLQHALVQLKLLADHRQCPPDVALARQAATPPSASGEATLRRITHNVCRYFGYRTAELRGPGRQRGIVHARSLAMYLARRLTGHTLAEIGQYFGGRDHTTVMHACQKMQTLTQANAELKIALEDLLEQLQPHSASG